MSTDKKGGVAVKDRINEKLQKPKMWKVILHNDDYTPMEFVVMVLMEIFFQTQGTAEKITMEVHTKGKGVAGTFTFEIAETKMVLVLQAAKAAQHPLQVSIEEE